MYRNYSFIRPMFSAQQLLRYVSDFLRIALILPAKYKQYFKDNFIRF